ncbi:MAG: argininosuccinate lyase [Thermoguttaceae bacterium]|jgi:argininosuccinate lyase
MAATKPEKNSGPAKAWGGVFTETTDKRMELFSESISFDHRLYKEDIEGSIAHARMLSDVGLLTAKEFQLIRKNLKEIEKEIEAGNFEFSTEKEDIHMHIESELIRRLGDVGRKLHTARSRNDQITTDMRLWIRGAIDHLCGLLRDLQKAFVGRCDRDLDVIIPGYTHTQRAQPVLAPHYWLSYCEKFERDRLRLLDCRKRVNVLSLGAAACAGTSLPIDRDKTAEYLGFDKVGRNSLDISGDRDFASEFAFDLAQIAIHLSGWAEEWIWWSTCEFNFLHLPQAFCTGSSIMPQKVNPDTLELIRGKTARVVGNLQSLLVLMKGLPQAYNRDMQEDKEPIFDSFDTVRASLELAAPLVAQTELNRESIAARIDAGYLDATSLMEYLIRVGIPQRTAHGIVGRLVRTAMNRGIRLSEIELEEMREYAPEIGEDVYKYLDALGAVHAMKSFGSTAPAEVKKQIRRWKRQLEL